MGPLLDIKVHVQVQRRRVAPRTSIILDQVRILQSNIRTTPCTANITPTPPSSKSPNANAVAVPQTPQLYRPPHSRYRPLKCYPKPTLLRNPRLGLSNPFDLTKEPRGELTTAQRLPNLSPQHPINPQQPPSPPPSAAACTDAEWSTA
jgi:hypothetical protein